MKKPSHFIVVIITDDALFHNPLTWNDECAGSLRCSSPDDTAALFTSRADARKAIRISSAFARLEKEQGPIFNEDFITGLKNIHIQPCSLTP